MDDELPNPQNPGSLDYPLVKPVPGTNLPIEEAIFEISADTPQKFQVRTNGDPSTVILREEIWGGAFT